MRLNWVRLLGACLVVMAGGLHATERDSILVGGATGRQGTAVVDELLSRGYRVRGMSRKPDGKKAQRLAAKGVEVVQADYADPESLKAAMESVDRVFFYSGFSVNEVEEGRNVVAAAKEAGIRHLVYSSGAAAAPENGIKGARKMQVELEIVDSGVPYTVFRPVAFMENFDGQQARTLEKGVIDSRDPDRMLHFIAIEDIGFFVAEAFEYPDQWLGRAVNIAGDAMTVAEMTATFSDVLGQEVAYNQQPLDEYLEGFPKPLRPLFRWYDEVGYTADVEGFREAYPDLTTLDQYLRATGWENWQE